MRLPEILFRLSRAPGSAGPLIELFSRRLVATASSTAVTASLAGPAKDKILVLTNATLGVDPGAAQAFTLLKISGRTPGGLTFQIIEEGQAAVADLRDGLNWEGEIMIGGSGVENTSIIGEGVFDAGVASNKIVLSVFGYVIPRGNIAPF